MYIAHAVFKRILYTHGPVRNTWLLYRELTILIIKSTISSLVIGLKKSYFPLIRLPSRYRTVCYYNIASRATQSNSVTYACSKSRWCTFALMAWANRFARNFFSRERPLLAGGKIFRYFATIMARNRDSTHQSQNEDNFRPFLLG